MKQEEEEKMAVVTEKMDELSAEMLSITENISFIQEQISQDGIILLKVCVSQSELLLVCLFKKNDINLCFLLQNFAATQDR